MKPMPGLAELRERGAMTWIETEGAWIARPDDVVDALSHQGFQEYKRESTGTGRVRQATGGMWQGLDRRTGAVASAIWVRRGEQSLIFIDVDGERVTEI